MLLEFSPEVNSAPWGVGGGGAYQGIPSLSALWVFLLKLHLVRLSHLKVWKDWMRAALALIAQSAPQGEGAVGYPLAQRCAPLGASQRGPAPSWPPRTTRDTAEDTSPFTAWWKDLCLHVCV